MNPGDIFAEKFEVIALLGEGGMSAVYKARLSAIGKIVALKLMHPWLATDATARQRFSREARAVTALNHPNIVKLLSFGNEGDQLYMAMEFIEGKSLAQHIRENGKLTPRHATNIFLQAARGLGHAHAQGLLHRDIKPANIMLLEDGRALVVDFGVAMLLDINLQTQQKLTQTNTVVGTPQYMSPEQCEKAALDERSDMYALGCVLYEMLSGYPPFRGDSALAVMFNHIHEEPSPLPEDVPPELNVVAMRMLEKNPKDRFASMDEIESAIEQATTAPFTVAQKKRARRPQKALVPIVASIAALLGIAGLVCVQPGIRKEERNRETRHRYSIKLQDAADSNKSQWDQSNILWREAIELGNPEGKPEARQAMEKLKQYFRGHEGGGNYLFCYFLTKRIPDYIELFHDDDKQWPELLMRACHTATMSLVVHHKIPEAKNITRTWFDLARKYSDRGSVIFALACRSQVGDLEGKELVTAVQAMLPTILHARADSAEAQMQVNYNRLKIAEAILNLDLDTATKIVNASNEDYDFYFGKGNTATAQTRLIIADWLFNSHKPGSKKEAKQILLEVLPILNASNHRNDMDGTVKAAAMLRDGYNEPPENTAEDVIRYSKILCDKFDQIVRIDNSRAVREAIVVRSVELANSYSAVNRHREALAALDRGAKYAAALPQNLECVGRLQSRKNAVLAELKRANGA